MCVGPGGLRGVTVTAKYSGEWWEKVAARPLEATLQPNAPSGTGRDDGPDHLLAEPAASQPTKPLSVAKAR